jgi:ssDNA-binding Zn-finger/Zn-ribbon topoisomerase 1
MANCKKCGAEMVIKSSKSGLSYVACPTCPPKEKKAGKGGAREGAHLPVKKDTPAKIPHWLDDYL